jgi:hypothetical protein
LELVPGPSSGQGRLINPSRPSDHAYRSGDRAVEPHDLASLDFLLTRAGKQAAIERLPGFGSDGALIVLCSTDFFGVHDSGSRAKARNEADS